MKYAIQQSVFVSGESVRTAPFAQVTITYSGSGNPASLWSDSAGATPITGNTINADASGYFIAYTDAGVYDVEIVAGSNITTLRDVAVGQDSQRGAGHYQGGMIHAAHRGYAAHSIENTMTSFSKAIQYRADALELDVQISSDGVPVVIHDSTVDYSTTSSGNVKDFTAAELRAMTRDARYGAIYEKSYIPTFAEVVALAKQHQIQIWPEVKGYRTIDDIALMVQVVKDAGYEHMTKFQSFNFVDLPVVRSLSSIVSLGHANGATDFRTYAADLLALGGECWIVTTIAKALAHPEYVAELQDMGIRVALYTAYFSSDVAKAERTGADAVICDRNLRGSR
jgi:glycerophosphoryl diester phosphodiesterase